MKYSTLAAAAAVLAMTGPMASPVSAQNDPITDAAIQSFLDRKPEAIMAAMQRAQDKQQQGRLEQINATVSPVARAIIAGDKMVPTLGNPKGTIQILEFYDYNCSYCKKFSSETMDPLLSKNKNVKFLMVMTPILGPGSERMAQFSAAAFMQGRYAAAHSFLIKQRAGSLEEADKLIPELIAFAGLNKAAFDKALTDGTAKAIVDHNAELARKAGVAGTPTLYFNGRTIPGAMPLEALESSINS